MIRFAFIIPILMKSNHNLIKNWDEKWKISNFSMIPIFLWFSKDFKVSIEIIKIGYYIKCTIHKKTLCSTQKSPETWGYLHNPIFFTEREYEIDSAIDPTFQILFQLSTLFYKLLHKLLYVFCLFHLFSTGRKSHATFTQPLHAMILFSYFR